MKLTIFVPLSRSNKVEQIGRQISNLEIPELISEVEYLVVVDNPWIRDLPGFPSGTQVVRTGLHPAPEMNRDIRRDHITKSCQIAANNTSNDSDFVLIVEDDGIIKPDSFRKLFNSYITKSADTKVKLGFITGVEAGRWGIKMIGLWRFDNNIEPSIIETMPYEPKGELVQIGAAGLYFTLVSAKIFRETTFEFGDFGPDVYFGKNLSSRGYSNFVDWSVVIGHDTGTRVLWPDKGCQVARFEKRDGRFRLVPK